MHISEVGGVLSFDGFIRGSYRFNALGERCERTSADSSQGLSLHRSR